MTPEQHLVFYLKKHLPSRESLELLLSAGVPTTGPNGLRRFIASQSVEAFCKLYFINEFTLPFPEIHRHFFADMQDVIDRARQGKSGSRLCRVIPRGHAKTTLYVRILSLHGFLFGWSPLTILLANTQMASERLLAGIREELETNDAILEDFGFIRGDIWQQAHIASETGNALRAFGRGSGSLRGVSRPAQRPSLVLLDDLDDDQSVRSATQLEADLAWIDKGVLSIGDQVTFRTSYIATGTLIARSSILQHLIDSPDFDAVVKQGITKFPDNSALWESWRQAFTTAAKEGHKPASPDDDQFYQEHKADLVAGSAVLWPRKDALWHMQLFRLSRGEQAFFSEIQNQPNEAGGNLGVLPIVPLPTNLSEWMLLSSLDPTIKGGKSNDKSAWVEAYFHPIRKEVIISFVDAKQRPASQTVDFVVNRLKKSARRYDSIWVESNSAGTLIASSIEQRVQADGMHYNITQIHNSAPKDERIGHLSVFVGRNQLYVANSVDPEFTAEWNGYPGYRYDDVLDAASTIILQLKKLEMLDLV